MNDCPDELGHLWERVSGPREWKGVLSATVACTRDGCNEVATEIVKEAS